MKFLLILIVVILIIAAPILWKIIVCGIHEKDYGLPTKWTLFSGCVIEVKKGIFVPADRYRGTVE